MLGTYLKNHRLQTILILGFSSGLPLALTGSTLQAWFTQAGVDLVTIGALSLLGLPYVWKFLWAPLFDRWIPPLLGRRRGWVWLAQIGLCASLFWMAKLDPAQHASMIGGVALLIALLSASQDIVIDAYRADMLLPSERGLGAAAATLGFRVAMLVSGGLALMMADKLGWQFTYQLMAVLLGLCTLATWFAPKEPGCVQPARTIVASMLDPFKDLLQRENILPIIVFVAIYKMGDALVLALASNFLLSVLHFSLTEVGVAFKTFGLIATLAGTFLGGLLLTRITLFSALIWFGILQAFSNGMFVLLALSGKSELLMVSTIMIESFCSGMSTAAFVAFIMSLCRVNYSATQYAFLSALFALGRVFAGPIAAAVVSYSSWVTFYEIAFLLSFPGLLLLFFMRRNIGFGYAKVVAPL